MSRNIVIYPNRGLTGSTDQPYITFSGLTAGSISLVVEDDGSITFDGDTGSLFGISDNKDGLLHSVNDVSGLPIFQVYDDDRLLMGKWDEPTLIISGQTFNILGGQNHMMLGGVTGSTIMGGKNITGSTSDMTYVPQLNIGTVGVTTSINNLGIDTDGYITTGSTGGGGSGVDPTKLPLSGGTLTLDTEQFRVETDQDSNAFVVSGDVVTIGLDAPDGNTKLHVRDSDLTVGTFESTASQIRFNLLRTSDSGTLPNNKGIVLWGDSANTGISDYEARVIDFRTTTTPGGASSIRLTIDNTDGRVTAKNDMVVDGILSAMTDTYLVNLPSESVLGTDADGKIIAGTGGGVDTTKLPLSGGTMTGPINISGTNLTDGSSTVLGFDTDGIVTTDTSRYAKLLHTGEIHYINAAVQTGKLIMNDVSNIPIWTMPNTTGTVALLSDITSEATSATTTTVSFSGQTIYYDANSPTSGTTIGEDLTGAKLGVIQKIYSNAATEPTYEAGWVLMGDGIYFTSILNIIYAEWAGGSRVEYWYVQEQ